MARVKLGLLAALVLAAQLPITTAAHAQPDRPEAAAQRREPGRLVTRSGEFAELSGQIPDLAFVSGEQVRITAQASDDIFAAGRDLRVEGASADHLFLAGREIDAAPAAVRDIIAAGGQFLLRAGVVSDDVVAAGGEIRLDRDARVEGSAVLIGGRLRIDAPLGGQLMASGRRVELNGSVAGDARIRAAEIVIGPQARIGGDLHLWGERIEVAPGAVVQGRTVREIVKREEHAAARFNVLGAVFGLGVLVMVGAIAAVLPRLVEGSDRRLRTRSWATLGIGALIVFLGPALIMALLATVLGAPLGLLLGLAYLLAIPFAFAGVSYWIGQFIRGRIAWARAHDEAPPPRWPGRFGWTALGALLLMLMCMIPIAGWLIWLVALVAGMGTLAAHLFQRQSEPPAAPASVAAA